MEIKNFDEEKFCNHFKDVADGRVVLNKIYDFYIENFGPIEKILRPSEIKEINQAISSVNNADASIDLWDMKYCSNNGRSCVSMTKYDVSKLVSRIEKVESFASWKHIVGIKKVLECESELNEHNEFRIKRNMEELKKFIVYGNIYETKENWLTTQMQPIGMDARKMVGVISAEKEKMIVEIESGFNGFKSVLARIAEKSYDDIKKFKEGGVDDELMPIHAKSGSIEKRKRLAIN